MTDCKLRVAHIDGRHQERANILRSISSESIYVASFDHIDEFNLSNEKYDFILIEYDDNIKNLLSILSKNRYSTPVFVYGKNPSFDSVIKAIHFGASYFIDAVELNILTSRIYEILEYVGQIFEPAKLLKNPHSDENCKLSDREMEILELVSEGQSSKSIARSLNISPRTVDAHRSKILKKLDAPRCTSAVRKIMALNVSN